MRKFAHEVEDMVRITPGAAVLKRLYEREDGDRPAYQPYSRRSPGLAAGPAGSTLVAT